MNGQDSAVNGVNKITLETIATTHDDLQQNYNALKDRYDVMAKRLEEIEAQNNAQKSDNKLDNKPDNKLELDDSEEITQMKNEAKTHSACIDEIQNNLNFLNLNFSKITDEVEDINQYLRLNSLLVHGWKNIPKGKHGIEFTEYVLNELIKLFPQHAKYLTPGVIDTSHPLPTRSNKKSVVIIKFVQRDIRNLLFFDKRELKGNKDGIVITEHLTQRNLSLLRQTRDLFGYKNAWSSKCKIYVSYGGRKYAVKNPSDLQQLCEQKHFNAAPINNELLLHSEDSTANPNVKSHSQLSANNSTEQDRFGNKNLSRPR